MHMPSTNISWNHAFYVEQRICVYACVCVCVQVSAQTNSKAVNDNEIKTGSDKWKNDFHTSNVLSPTTTTTTTNSRSKCMLESYA